MLWIECRRPGGNPFVDPANMRASAGAVNEKLQLF
jgi:hypothetical protein